MSRECAEQCEDRANRRLNRPDHMLWKTAARGFRFLSGGGAKMGGGWYGNETVWRMVLDLNRILVYGRADGTMSDQPQRNFFSLTDALIAGEGDGPLRPSPLPLGAVTFGVSPVACDFVHAALLRLDASKIPLLRESTGRFRWPLCRSGFVPEAVVSGESWSLAQVSTRLGVDAIAPAGWQGRMEWGDVRPRAGGHEPRLIA